MYIYTQLFIKIIKLFKVVLEMQNESQKMFDGSISFWKDKQSQFQSTICSISKNQSFDASTQYDPSIDKPLKLASKMKFQMHNIQIQIWNQSFANPCEKSKKLVQNPNQYQPQKQSKLIKINQTASYQKGLTKKQKGPDNYSEKQKNYLSILKYPDLPTLSQINSDYQQRRKSQQEQQDQHNQQDEHNQQDQQSQQDQQDYDQQQSEQESDSQGYQQTSKEISRQIVEATKIYKNQRVQKTQKTKNSQKIIVTQQMRLIRQNPKKKEEQQQFTYFESSVTDLNVTEQQIIDLMTESEISNKNQTQKVQSKIKLNILDNQKSQQEQRSENESQQEQRQSNDQNDQGSQGDNQQQQNEEKLQDYLNKSSYQANEQAEAEVDRQIQIQDLFLCYGKWLMQAFSSNSLAQMSQTCLQYNSSNYFHVGPRYSMLSSLREIVNKLNNLMKYQGHLLQEVPEQIRDYILEDQQEEHIYNLGAKIGNQVLAKSKSFLSTISTYYSSNYFHVGPRYQMIGFMRLLISEITKCRQMQNQGHNIANQSQIQIARDAINSSISTAATFKF